MVGVLVASTAVGVVAGAAGARVAGVESSRAWVDELASTAPDDEGATDRGLREIVLASWSQMLVAWFGLAILLRAGCHAWSRLLVNAVRARRGTGLLSSDRALEVAATWRPVYADAWSDAGGRAGSFIVAVAVLAALPVVPWSRPFLAAVYGSQALFLFGDLVVLPVYAFGR